MKKIIATVLCCCLVLGVASCGNITNNTNAESSTNGTLFNEEYYGYATKALNTVDQYLSSEIEKEEALSIVTDLGKNIEENGDYGVKTLGITLELLEITLGQNNFDFSDIEEYRDDLASLVKSPLLYRETAKKAFDVNSKDFFDMVNASLQYSDSSLVLELDKVEEIEKEEENYLPVSFYVLKHNNVLIEYETDDATDKLLGLELKLDFGAKTIKEDDVVALGGYIGVMSTFLETEKDVDKLVELINRLDLENFSEISIKSYDTDTVQYTKTFMNNNFSLIMKPM